jgi:hypothetical protein
MRDLFDPFGCDSPAAEHISEEGTDVVTPLRAAEGDEENGVEHLQSSMCSLSISNAIEEG